MGKEISQVVFELDRVYDAYANQLNVSHAVSTFLHASADLRASGNQIEGSIRTLLAELLPPRIAVGHGHIVDQSMALSRQQDILICEGEASKSILKTLDGTEFFMFESVYSVGEVKKTLSKTSFEDAIQSLSDTKGRLTREKVAPNIFATTPDRIAYHQNLTRYEYRNPLFSFFFSIDFDSNFKINQIKNTLLDRTKWPTLPNLIVVLNKGIFLVIDNKATTHDHVSIKLYPEFEATNDDCSWYFLPLDDHPGRSLAYLVAMLQQHIQDALLFRPSLLHYAQGLMGIHPKELTIIE